MKRHLTVLAASAMLAAFAGMAMAEDAPAAAVDAAATVAPVAAPVLPDSLATKKYVVNVGGHLDYAVEYDAQKRAWTDGADEGILDPVLNVAITTPDAAGNPKLTWTFNPLNNGTDSGVSVGTISGTLFDTTLNLGRVNGNYDGDWSAGRTEGAGASITKKLGNITFDAFTSKTALTTSTENGTFTYEDKYVVVAKDGDAPEEGVGDAVVVIPLNSGAADAKGNTYYWVQYAHPNKDVANVNATGGRVTLDLGNGNSAYGFAVVNSDFEGVGQVGGKYVGDMFTLDGKAAMELGKASGTDKAWKLAATVTPFDGLSFNATAWEVDKGYTPAFALVNDLAAFPGEEHMDRAAWNVGNGMTDNVTTKVGATLDLIKDKDTVVSNAYLNYANFANKANYNYVQLGGKNTDIYLADAYVKFINDSSNEYNVTFSNTISDVTLTAQGKVRTFGVGTPTDTWGTNNWTYGLLKAEKTFGWLKTWAALEKPYPSKDDQSPVVHPKVGASVSVKF